PYRGSNEDTKLRVMAVMGTPKKLLAAAGLLALVAAAPAVQSAWQPAWAQTGKNYDVKTMNFDMWCQEQAHLPPERCDKRSDADEKEFEAYRAQIERYEVPYLQEKRNDLTLDRRILHNDPVDNPLQQDPEAQRQAPDERPRTPNP